MNSLPMDRLRKLVRLDENTGEVIRVAPGGSRARVGRPVGSLAVTGYLETKLDGVRLLVHRVAYALHNGYWPSEIVDHMNGNRVDNRPENLRLLTNRTNARNITAPHAGNASGYLGVTWSKSKNKWQATICTNGKRQYLGAYECAKEAHEVYRQHKVAAHPEWSGISNNKEGVSQ